MSPKIPTVDELLQRHSIGNELCQWPTQGGSVTIDSATLRQALEDAYDPLMPDWPVFVDLDDEAADA